MKTIKTLHIAQLPKTKLLREWEFIVELQHILGRLHNPILSPWGLSKLPSRLHTEYQLQCNITRIPQNVSIINRLIDELQPNKIHIQYEARMYGSMLRTSLVILSLLIRRNKQSVEYVITLHNTCDRATIDAYFEDKKMLPKLLIKPVKRIAFVITHYWYSYLIRTADTCVVHDMYMAEYLRSQRNIDSSKVTYIPHHMYNSAIPKVSPKKVDSPLKCNVTGHTIQLHNSNNLSYSHSDEENAPQSITANMRILCLGSYFDTTHLEQILEECVHKISSTSGITLSITGTLPTLTNSKLLERIKYAGLPTHLSLPIHWLGTHIEHQISSLISSHDIIILPRLNSFDAHVFLSHVISYNSLFFYSESHDNEELPPMPNIQNGIMKAVAELTHDIELYKRGLKLYQLKRSSNHIRTLYQLC